MDTIIINDYASYTMKFIDEKLILTPKDNEYEWEEIHVNIGHGDDYFKMDKNTDINEVKDKCIELGSLLFVTKHNCQYYIRSPPDVKKKRDYKSIKNIAESMISAGKEDTHGYKSYVLNYY